MDKNHNQGSYQPYQNVPSELDDSDSRVAQAHLPDNLAAQVSSYQHRPISTAYGEQSSPPVYPSLPAYSDPQMQGHNAQMYNQSPYNYQYPSLNPVGPYQAGFVSNHPPVVFQSIPAPPEHGMVQQHLPGPAPGNLGHPEAFTIKDDTMKLKLPTFVKESCFKVLFPRQTAREPIVTHCSACNRQTTTRVSTDCGCGLVSCVAASFLCCPYTCWVPCVMQDCYDISHHCSNCGNRISKERFLCR